MCLKDLRDEFIYDCECRHLAKGSLRNYKAATRFLVEYLELKQITELEDVRPRHIRDLMKEKQDAGSTSRYINDLLKVWRTWFNYLVNEGYLEERDNPAKKVKCLRQPRTIIDTFTVAEMKRMVQFYDGKDFLEVRNKTIIMLLFDTGMRYNEMILMEPEDRRSRLRIFPTSIVPHPRSSVVNAVEMAWTARSELKIIPIKLAPAVPRRYPVTLMIMIIPAVNSRFRFFFRQTRRIIAIVSTVRNSSSPIPASRHRMVTAAWSNANICITPEGFILDKFITQVSSVCVVCRSVMQPPQSKVRNNCLN